MNTETIYCPVNIEVLLHCHSGPDPVPRADAPAVGAAILRLVELGAITPNMARPGASYETTPLGKAWVQALCNVPLPRPAFVDEQGRVL